MRAEAPGPREQWPRQHWVFDFVWFGPPHTVTGLHYDVPDKCVGVVVLAVPREPRSKPLSPHQNPAPRRLLPPPAALPITLPSLTSPAHHRSWFTQIRGVKEMILFPQDQAPFLPLSDKYDPGAYLCAVDITAVAEMPPEQRRLFEQARCARV